MVQPTASLLPQARKTSALFGAPDGGYVYANRPTYQHRNHQSGISLLTGRQTRTIVPLARKPYAPTPSSGSSSSSSALAASIRCSAASSMPGSFDILLHPS
eukprot:jgi/Picre1/35395/NNA_002857.t1